MKMDKDAKQTAITQILSTKEVDDCELDILKEEFDIMIEKVLRAFDSTDLGGYSFVRLNVNIMKYNLVDEAELASEAKEKNDAPT